MSATGGHLSSYCSTKRKIRKIDPFCCCCFLLNKSPRVSVERVTNMAINFGVNYIDGYYCIPFIRLDPKRSIIRVLYHSFLRMNIFKPVFYFFFFEINQLSRRTSMETQPPKTDFCWLISTTTQKKSPPSVRPWPVVKNAQPERSNPISIARWLV